VSNVRVLCVLTTRKAGFGRAPVAREARLNPRGVHAIIDRLALAGIVNVQQRGRSGIFTLRENHPLTRVIRRLFQEEGAFDRIVTTVHDPAGAAISDVRADWVTAGSSIGTAKVGVLASAKEVDRASYVLKQLLRTSNRTWRFISSFARTLTRSAMSSRNPTHRSTSSGDGSRSTGNRVAVAHFVRMETSTNAPGALAAHIAKRIAEDPAMVDRAVEWIDQRDRLEADPSKRAL
jgi:hypothetical protein